MTKLQQQALGTARRLVNEAGGLLVSAGNADTLRTDGAERLLGTISDKGTPANKIWVRLSEAESWIVNALENK